MSIVTRTASATTVASAVPNITAAPMKKTAESATRPAGRPRSRIGDASTSTPAANTAATAAQVDAGGGSSARAVSDARGAAKPASATGAGNGSTRRNDVRSFSWTFTL